MPALPGSEEEAPPADAAAAAAASASARCRVQTGGQTRQLPCLKLIGRSSVQYVAVLLLSLFWRTSNDDNDDGRSM